MEDIKKQNIIEEESHLPWDNTTIKEIALKMIATGETAKVDFKRDFNLSGSDNQAEFLKDVSAIANTYCQYYKNHGFIIFGAEQHNIVYAKFLEKEDHLQAHIDDLITKYLGPFITTHLFIFNDNDNQWGVLVIPPTRQLPHVFIKDIHKRYRGDIYIRNGTITEKAQPADYARFFSQSIEDYAYNFQQNISELKQQVLDLNKQFKNISSKRIVKNKIKEIELSNNSLEVSKSLTENIDIFFAKEEDFITKGLFEEANKINNFLNSNDIPWVIGTNNKEESKKIINQIESISNEFWIAIINIILKDNNGKYEDVLVKTISYLAQKIEPVSGTSYNETGRYVRYYPLFIALYLISIICVAQKKDKLLKKIFKINLRVTSHYEDSLPITYMLFYIRRAEDFFHPLYESFPSRKWCDPVAAYTKLLIDKILNPRDFLWDKEREFFNGEFVLCLSPLDLIEKETQKPMIKYPSSGMYLYISSSIPIISRFIKDEKDWLIKIFERPIKDIFYEFDQGAKELPRGFCFGSGFMSGAEKIAFPDK